MRANGRKVQPTCACSIGAGKTGPRVGAPLNPLPRSLAQGDLQGGPVLGFRLPTKQQGGEGRKGNPGGPGDTQERTAARQHPHPGTTRNDNEANAPDETTNRHDDSYKEGCHTLSAGTPSPSPANPTVPLQHRWDQGGQGRRADGEVRAPAE